MWRAVYFLFLLCALAAFASATWILIQVGFSWRLLGVAAVAALFALGMVQRIRCPPADPIFEREQEEPIQASETTRGK